MQVDLALEKHLAALETQLLQPDARQSADQVANLLADEFIEFGSSGRVFTKREIIDALQSESPAHRTLSDFKAMGLAQDVILVTYRITRIESSRQLQMHSIRSSIWKLIDGHWQMVFHQGTLTDHP